MSGMETIEIPASTRYETVTDMLLAPDAMGEHVVIAFHAKRLCAVLTPDNARAIAQDLTVMADRIDAGEMFSGGSA